MKILNIIIPLFIVCLSSLSSIAVFAIPSDQNSVMLKSWSLPAQNNENASLSISTSYGGSEVYFVESGANKIGRLVPSTNSITEWGIPTSSSLPIAISVDSSKGNVYFVESGANKIGRLVPSTNSITEWGIPTNSSLSLKNTLPNTVCPSSPNLGKSNTVCPHTTNPSTTNATNPSTTNATNPIAIEVDPSTGNVFYVDNNAKVIGRLIASNNTITEWKIAGDKNELKDLTIGYTANEIYFVESGSNKIGQLITSTNTITEWGIPTSSSLPTAIDFDPSTGNVYFVESGANKIGRFVPSNGEFTEWALQGKPGVIDVDSSGNIHFMDIDGNGLSRLN
jgi:virginiamycin B lyase